MTNLRSFRVAVVVLALVTGVLFFDVSARADDKCYTFDGDGDSIFACYQKQVPGTRDNSPPPQTQTRRVVRHYTWYYFHNATHIVPGQVTTICWAIWRTTSQQYALDEQRRFNSVHNMVDPPYRFVPQARCPVQVIPPLRHHGLLQHASKFNNRLTLKHVNLNSSHRHSSKLRQLQLSRDCLLI